MRETAPVSPSPLVAYTPRRSRAPQGLQVKAGADVLSVVIPSLNAARELPATLSALAEGERLGLELIVADGGSTDGTPALAARAGAHVVDAPPGRGPQLRSGADAASEPWLLFLHADTRPAPGWSKAVAAFATKPRNARRAAAFRFALDDPSPAARRLEALVTWRCRVLALPYGDQGLLLSRAFYDALGGFRPIPLMEDVDLVRRIGRSRLAFLDVAAVTSAARYQGAGYLRRSAKSLLCLGLYFLGLPPRHIARIYE